MPRTCLAFLLALPLYPADLAPKVDALFSQWDHSNSPGCSLSVSRDGRILYSRAYGMADLNHDLALSPQSVFHVASISKQFVAASIVLLAQQGKLSYDDPVRKYIPELPDFGQPLTLRHLLHHVSGLRDQWSLLSLAGWRVSEDVIRDEDVLWAVSRMKELNFAPGAEYSYSNTGFTLLAQVVKRVSGRSLRQFTTDEIFHPLGMNSTHFRDNHREIVKNLAYGYEPAAGGFREGIPHFDTVGASSLLTTVEDLVRWQHNFEDPKLGGRAFVDALLQPFTLTSGKQIDYRFGLVVTKYRGLDVVEHEGADAGYRSALVRFPDQHLSVACLCNAVVPAGKLAHEVAEIYLAGQLQPAVPSTPEPDKPRPAIAKATPEYAGRYYSEEIDSTYEIESRDGALILHRKKSITVPLAPGPAADEFYAGPLGSLHFERNAAAKIKGFRLTTGRVRNLKFARE